MYLETIDEKGVPMLVLDTVTDRQLPTDHITEQDTGKYFAPPDEKEDGNDTETISSMSTTDYDQEEVEMSLATVAEAFHTIGSEYEWFCAIAPHMTKVQAASVISRLPVIPYPGKKEKVKAETKPEMGTTEPTTEMSQVPETSQVPEMSQVSETSRVSEAPRVPRTSQVSEVPQVPETPRVSEQERESTRTVEPQVAPSTSGRAEVEEIDLERDAEVSRKLLSQ